MSLNTEPLSLASYIESPNGELVFNSFPYSDLPPKASHIVQQFLFHETATLGDESRFLKREINLLVESSYKKDLQKIWEIQHVHNGQNPENSKTATQILMEGIKSNQLNVKELKILFHLGASSDLTSRMTKSMMWQILRNDRGDLLNFFLKESGEDPKNLIEFYDLYRLGKKWNRWKILEAIKDSGYEPKFNYVKLFLEIMIIGAVLSLLNNLT